MSPDEHLALASLAHLDVDCGRRNGTVAQKPLNMPQIHTAFQEQRGTVCRSMCGASATESPRRQDERDSWV